ncbi:MAG: adenylate kinase [Elusimicrobiota bacterium]|jgi:adenylate kinase
MSATELRLVLLGAPGVGKGTQAKALCDRYRWGHLSTGNIFRAEVSSGTPLGRKVGDYMKRGVLVPDETVIEVVAAKLDAIDGGWLLDGFPRTLEQAQALDKYLSSNGRQIDLVVSLEAKIEEIVRRLSGRRSCACGEVYNVFSRPARAEGVCDKCGAKLTQREDDSEAVVRKRMMVYEDLTRPLISYYRSSTDFVEVDGGLSAQEVSGRVAAVVEKVLAQRSAASK